MRKFETLDFFLKIKIFFQWSYDRFSSRRGKERKKIKNGSRWASFVSVLIDTWTTSLSMHHRVMHMHFSLLQQLHDHFPLVAAARSIYGELLFLLIVSTVDFSFHFLFSTFRYVIFIPCTNNNIREWDEDKREFEFRIDLFYFPLWNSLNGMKLSLLNNYDQENNNFSRWYISIFFSFSIRNLVFVFSLPFLFFFQNIFRETKLLEIVWNCAWREFVTQFVNVNQYIWWKYRCYGSCSLFEIVNPPVENDRTCTGNARRSA